MEFISDIFEVTKPIIGMVHLLPLPGAPRYDGDGLESILNNALNDAKNLAEGGINGILIENYRDNPFKPMTKDPETIIPMALIARELKKEIDLPLGIQVLRCSPESSLAIAKFTGGQFIRCTPLVGALVTDQGILQGCAHDLLRYRKTLNAEDVKIFSDAISKHGAPLVQTPIDLQAKEVAYRGMADALLVCGPRTGEEPELDHVELVKRAVPDKPLFIASGFTKNNADKFLKYADGALVGTSIKVESKTENPIDMQRVLNLMKVVNKVRKLS